MPLYFADLGPSGLARRYGAMAVDDKPSAPAQRLEAARKAVGDVTRVTKSVTKVAPLVTKVESVTKGRPAVHETAAERQRAYRERKKASLQP